MTTNREKAAEIIGNEYMDAMSGPTPSAWRGQIAEALDDAELLTDDDLLAQIDRVRKVADLLDRMAEDNGRLADSLSSEYSKGKHDAYANAAKFIREVTGDSNE